MGKNGEKLLQVITILFLMTTIGSVVYREKTFHEKIMNRTEAMNEKVTVLEKVYKEENMK
ncbi:MAG: hypothetical protein N4A62_08815 [Marinisporobacter sp.]|jgi:hypothetical protein|nr:hypothetical protein [Marinisporobacter sp.]